MRHVYNEKISPRANDSLRRREQKVTVQKRIIALVCILVVSLLILLGSSIRTFASSRNNESLHKYYTSVQIKSGDTLWNLADQYTVDGVYNRDDFIQETCELNQLSDINELHEGEYLVVGYYSSDIK